jgi:hypothetical protein
MGIDVFDQFFWSIQGLGFVFDHPNPKNALFSLVKKSAL